jgi:protein-L-isoaspartate(D-aspartate) O-methyltransferase
MPHKFGCSAVHSVENAQDLMIDFAAARRRMVDGQLRTNEVTDLRIIEAMLELPRERFVPERMAPLAYLDMDIAAGNAAGGTSARWLLKPMVLARLVQAAALAGNEHVLDVGCATGYSSALLSRLAASVIGLEEDSALAQQAHNILAQLGTSNVSIVSGPLAEGWPAGKPYDVVLINGVVEVLPPTYLKQMTEGGRLLCVRGRPSAGKAMLYRAEAGEFSGRVLFDAAAPLLPDFVAPPTFVF